MKKFLMISLAFGAGVVFNTEPGKKLRGWALSKAQDLTKSFVNKIDEVTAEEPTSGDV